MYCLSEILTFLDSHSKAFSALSSLFAIGGIFIAILTLYYNFLKGAQLNIFIGKSAITLFHNPNLKSCLMIDISCSFLNEGARTVVVEKLKMEVSHNQEKIIFLDYLFLRLESSKDSSSWIQENYSHPIMLDKYSRDLKNISFKCQNPEFSFSEPGIYNLKIEALNKNICIAEDKVHFILSPEEIKKLSISKQNNNKDSIEISLITFSNNTTEERDNIYPIMTP